MYYLALIYVDQIWYTCLFVCSLNVSSVKFVAFINVFGSFDGKNSFSFEDNSPTQ